VADLRGPGLEATVASDLSEVADVLDVARVPGAPSSAPPADLDRIILRSSAWVALSWGGRNALSMLGAIVLARLLDPRAFGLVAIALTITTVLDYIQESGVGAALIQRRGDVKQAAASALVWSSCAGLTLGALCFAAAPWLARGFGAPAATNVIRAMSLLLVIRGVSIGPGSMLEREMNFRTRTFGELAAGFAQLGISLGMAVAGFGVWSLVVGQLAATAIQSTIVWLLAPWRPHPRDARLSLLREMLRYGRFVSLGNVLGLINRTLDNLVVGRVLGAGALGVYSIAYRLGDFPTGVVGYIVGRVMFPAYSRLQDDLGAFRAAFVQNMERVALLSLPASVALLVYAEPIVTVLLGGKWLAAVTPLRILAVYTIVRSFVSPTGAVFQAGGKPHLVPLWALPQSVLFPIGLIVLVPKFGVEGAAIAVLVSFSASGIPALRSCMRMLELRATTLLSKLLPLFVASALMGGAMELTSRLRIRPVESLGAGILVGGFVYIAAVAVLARPLLSAVWAGLRPGPRRRANRRWADVDGIEGTSPASSGRREHT
jgi:O-antigen/teichoic acid export membrane protein